MHFSRERLFAVLLLLGGYAFTHAMYDSIDPIGHRHPKYLKSENHIRVVLNISEKSDLVSSHTSNSIVCPLFVKHKV